MDTLPLKLVYCVVERVDVLTLPALCCVGPSWYSLVNMARPHFERDVHHPRKGDDKRDHVCTLNARCAMRYAQKLVHLGRWSLLEWMQNIARGDLHGLAELHRHVCTKAASDDDLRRLQCLTSESMPVRACERAARHGHLRVLERALGSNDVSAMDICEQAAAGGHMHVLQWAVGNGFKRNSMTCAHAARYGHFDVLQWIMAQGCP